MAENNTDLTPEQREELESQIVSETLNAGDEQSREIRFSKVQKNMFDGFSENFYGNNWFVLSNNENGSASAICGVLKEVPKLSFSTDLVNGPATKLIDKLKEYTGRGSIGNTIGSAAGANLNPQVAGNFSMRFPMKCSFQKDGIKLEFTAWKKPTAVFDSVCPPSSMEEVIKYLTRFATVETQESMSGVIEQIVKQGAAGVSSLGPILGSAVDSVKATIQDQAKKNIPGYSFLSPDSSAKEKKQDSGESDVSAFQAINAMADSFADFVDNTLVRHWSDKQRITHGRTKFNETLHRLDILRAGILDTYLIVAITDWEYQIDQSALGERMTVSINCMIDQRMSRDRLKLYGKRAMFR